MTKVSVFGQENTEVKKELKKIQFIKYIDSDNVSFAKNNPSEFDEVILVCKRYFNQKYDLILARRENETTIAYLGHWNDGIV